MKMSKEREPEKAISSESSKGEEDDDDYSSEDTDSEHSAPPPAVRKPRTTGQTQSVTAKNPTTPSIPKPATPVPSSQETESETESEPEPESEEYSEKPKEKGNDKAAVAVADLVPRRVGSRRKRPTNGEIETEERRSNKTRKKQAQASEKKQAFQRIWSEADELAVLRGIVEFRAEKKCDPAAKVDSFLDFIEKNLHIEVSTKQLKDKMCRMKKKFTNNKKKGRSFKNQHEQEAHDLAEKVWGSEIEAHENGSQSHSEDTRAGEMVQTRAKSGRFKENGKPLEVIIIEEMKAYSRKVEIKAQQFQLLLQNMKSPSY